MTEEIVPDIDSVSKVFWPKLEEVNEKGYFECAYKVNILNFSIVLLVLFM